MIELNEKKILTKGRLGPGEIIGVRIEKGKVFNNKKIKEASYLDQKRYKIYIQSVKKNHKKITYI